MASYLTAAQIATRLSDRFAITATITAGDADIASNELDASGPFIGEKQVSTQERAFPRSVNPDGSVNSTTTLPDAVLDWIALRAYQLSVDDDSAVKSESVGDISITYASSRLPLSKKRMTLLLVPYLKYPSGFADIEISSSFDRRL